MAKFTLPDALKSDVPQTVWGRVLAATPVVMTVLATALAGLASSEMTRAQYDRSLGAQQQSKAGDQWGFFQAKRLRGALQRNTLDLLQNTAELQPLDPMALKTFAEQLPAQLTQAEDRVKESLQRVAGSSTASMNDAQSAKAALERYLQGAVQRRSEANKVKTEMMAVLESAAGQQALAALQLGQVPGATAGAALDPKVKAAVDAIANSEPDAQITSLSAQVDNPAIEAALRTARAQAQDFETANKPATQTIEQLENLLARGTACLQQRPALLASNAIDAGASLALTRNFTAARMRYTALRYDTEARLNQAIANLYELQVRKSNMSAERHHKRSQRFFFGMLGAQTGVIISTFAMAARKRNLLWSLAAAAGLLAVAFAIYVYLCM